MTHKQNYAALVESVFGAGSARFDSSDQGTNNVIGALANLGDYRNFRAAFDARLRRLKSAMVSNPALTPQLLTTVNSVGYDTNWDGAFAELAALDYFFADQRTGPGDAKLDVTVDAKDTLASQLGSTHANHDLVLPSFNVSLNTKLLSDKIGDILEGIFNEVRKRKGIASLAIVPSYRADQDFELFQRERRNLVAELDTLADTRLRPRGAQSKIIPDLSYQFAWEAGVYASASGYSPKKHGAHHHTLLFKHAKKFSKVGPSGITFVHFPWSGEQLVPLDNANLVYFKALAETFFQRYTNSSAPASQFDKRFNGSVQLSDVASCLSVVMFLEDKSVTAIDPTLINVQGSFYLNPAARHSLAGSAFESYLLSRGAVDLRSI